MDGYDKYSATYLSERGEVFIRVFMFKESDWSTTGEQDNTGYPREHNGIQFYITTNSEQSKAGWQIGSCSYTVNGQITEDELNRMIDSIKWEEP